MKRVESDGEGLEENNESAEKRTNCKLLVEPIAVAFAKRRGKSRLLILLLLLNLFLAFGASCGQ